MTDPLSVTVFSRRSLSLHALLLENQPWFCARDLGRLMGFHLSDRIVSKLDEDQRQRLLIEYYGQPEERLMISESGAYALLVYHYAPENRLLREWFTHQVVPALRDAGGGEKPGPANYELDERAWNVAQSPALAGRKLDSIARHALSAAQSHAAADTGG